MADVQIRETTLLDAAQLAGNLRLADAREVWAYGFNDPLEPLVRSVSGSLLCWTATVDGEVAAILGVSPLSVMNGIGAPWMMGTPLLDRHSRVLVRKTPDYIARMQRAFPVLENYVHAANTTSVRWLRRLGFALHDPEPYGMRGEMFHRFEKRA